MVRHPNGRGAPPLYAETMQFSKRTGWEPGENAWAEALRARRASGAELVDLTVSNPTACGLGPQGVDQLAPLAAPGALRYSPDPLGMPQAREAVARYYAEAGARLPPEHLCLTTSTSEAYSFLFRLLCDPGDEVLIARPSYPLFDLLARLDDVVLREYPLFYEPGGMPGGMAPAGGGWSLDLEALKEAITPRTRAVIVVHPNNPTGNYVAPGERAALRALCARHGLALIADEVFLDYPLPSAAAEPGLPRSFAAEPSDCLCFVLSGLSKICAMPQVKLSWMAVLGPAGAVAEAMERIEVISDTFLSVAGPTQYALPHWLESRQETQARIRERVTGNLQRLDLRLQGSLDLPPRGSLANRLSLQGGWTAVLRVPAFVDGEAFALTAVARGVAVQPGTFYGFPEGFCVLSLLTPREEWERGLALLPIDLGP